MSTRRRRPGPCGGPLARCEATYSYEATVDQLLSAAGRPLTTTEITEHVGRRYRCTGPYALSEATVAAHLDDMRSRGTIHRLAEGDAPAWLHHRASPSS